MSVVNTTVAKIDADASGVKKEMKDAKKDVEGFGKQFDDLKGNIQNAMIGLFAMEKVMQAAGAAIDFVKDSTRAYIDTNKDAQAVLAGTSGKLEDMKKSLGEAILGGDNLNEVMGGLNLVLDGFKRIIAENRDRIQEFVKNGLQMAISVLGKMGYVVAGVVGAFQAVVAVVKVAYEYLKAYTNMGVLFASTFVDAVGGALLTVVEGFDNVAQAGLNALQVMAKVTNSDSLGKWADDQSKRIGGIAVGFRDTLEEVRETAQNIRRGAESDLQENFANMRDIGTGLLDSFQRNFEAADNFNEAITTGLAEGTIASNAIRGNLEAGANAAASIGRSSSLAPGADAKPEMSAADKQMQEMGEYFTRQAQAQAQARAQAEADAIAQVVAVAREKDAELAALAAERRQREADEAAAAAAAEAERIAAPGLAVQEAMTQLGDSVKSTAQESAGALTQYFGQAFAGILTGSKKTDESFGKMAKRMAASMAGTFAQLFTQLGAGMIFVNPAAGIGLIAAGIALSTLASLMGDSAGKGAAKTAAATESPAPSGPAAPSANNAPRNVYLVQSNYDMFPTDEGNLRRFAGMNRMAREAGLLGFQTSAVG